MLRRPFGGAAIEDCVRLASEATGVSGVAERYRLSAHTFEYSLTLRHDLRHSGVKVYDLTFPSPMKTDIPENNTVHAELFLPEGKGPFPAAVVAYCPGALDESVLQRFRDGMTRANQTLVGRQLLAACRLTGFEPVPAEYHKWLEAILKAYPAPEPAQGTARKPK